MTPCRAFTQTLLEVSQRCVYADRAGLTFALSKHYVIGLNGSIHLRLNNLCRTANSCFPPSQSDQHSRSNTHILCLAVTCGSAYCMYDPSHV